MYDLQVVGLISGRVTLRWLLPGRLTVCGQVNQFGV